jgi:hypothetical protein
MPPSPSEEQFLATASALAAAYAAAIPALEAQIAQLDEDPIVLTYGDWARATSTLLDTLHDLNAQVNALSVPPRYAASWGQMLVAVDLLERALDKFEEGVGNYNLQLIGESKQEFAAAKAVLLGAVPALEPLPVVVVNVPAPVVIPVTTPGAGTVVVDANVCSVCPSPTAIRVVATPTSVMGKGGVVDGAPTVATATVIAPPVSTARVVTATVVVSIPITVPGTPTPVTPTPTVATGPVATLPVPQSPTPIAPTPAATASLASGGLGLTLDEWMAVHGQPDALVEGLYLFDEPDQSYSLLVVNGRISTIYVAWKPTSRPNLAVAQGEAIQLIPRDSSLVQASTLTLDTFVGQYHSPQLAIVFPNAPYAPQPAGSFIVYYEMAEDGLVFQMTIGIGLVVDTQ